MSRGFLILLGLTNVTHLWKEEIGRDERGLYAFLLGEILNIKHSLQ